MGEWAQPKRRAVGPNDTVCTTSMSQVRCFKKKHYIFGVISGIAFCCINSFLTFLVFKIYLNISNIF